MAGLAASVRAPTAAATATAAACIDAVNLLRLESDLSRDALGTLMRHRRMASRHVCVRHSSDLHRLRSLPGMASPLLRWTRSPGAHRPQARLQRRGASLASASAAEEAAARAAAARAAAAQAAGSGKQSSSVIEHSIRALGPRRGGALALRAARTTFGLNWAPSAEATFSQISPNGTKTPIQRFQPPHFQSLPPICLLIATCWAFTAAASAAADGAAYGAPTTAAAAAATSADLANSAAKAPAPAPTASVAAAALAASAEGSAPAAAAAGAQSGQQGRSLVAMLLCGAAIYHAFFSSLWTASPRNLVQLPRHFLSPPAAVAVTAEIQLPKPTAAKVATATPAQEKLPQKELYQKALYYLDDYLAVEPAGKAVLLFCGCVLLWAVGAVLYRAAIYASNQDEPMSEVVWTSWTFVSDPGQHTDEVTFPRRVVGLLVTLGGMLVFALLVGLMGDTLRNKVDALNQGLTPVAENRHVIVVGWTTKTTRLVRELVAADKGRAVVVLGREDKQAMEEALRESLPDELRKEAKVTARTGDPLVNDDLERCSIGTAQSVVLVSPDNLPSDAADSQVMQASVALMASPSVSADIVAELRRPQNVPMLHDLLATLLQDRGQKEAAAAISTSTAGERQLVAVSTADLQLRLLLNRALYPDAVEVARELLRADGCEFHSKIWPELVGKTFGDVLFMFDDAVPCGVLRRGSSSEPSGKAQSAGATAGKQKQKQDEGRVLDEEGREQILFLNPPLDWKIEANDELLVIAEDSNSYAPGKSQRPTPSPSTSASTSTPKKKSKAEGLAAAAPSAKRNILICGWRPELCQAFAFLDLRLGQGSTVTIFSEELSQADRKLIRTTMKKLRNFKLQLKSSSSITEVESIRALPVETYDVVLVLSDDEKSAAAEVTGDRAADKSDSESGADGNEGDKASGLQGVSKASTFAMLLRSIQAERGRTAGECTVVAELPAGRGDVLEEVQQRWVDHAVNGDEMQALILAQLAEDPDVGCVLEEVVSGRGSSFALTDALAFVADGDQLSFWELQQRVSGTRSILVAHKCAEGDGAWQLNPPDKAKKITWRNGDKLVLLKPKA